MTGPRLLTACVLFAAAQTSDAIDRKYPLGPQLRVLAQDVDSPKYRKLVTQEMLVTDLAAEWQRVETEDNADRFLAEHGGKDKVLADRDLKVAYERRVAIRDKFLGLMRESYKRYKQVPPFDRGEKAELAGTRRQPLAAGTTALGLVLPAPGSERQWPRFRGPSGQGITHRKQLAVHWSRDSSNIVWQVPVPGSGNSSPVIWSDRIFLTSANETGTERTLHCFSRPTGKRLWSAAAASAAPESGVRDKNGFASATPATDGERIVSFLGSCGLVCHDFDGTLLWQYKDFKIDTTHGTGSSPLLYKHLVIFAHDQNRSDSIFFAVDKRTGKRVWQTSRKRAMTWSTPVVVQAAGRAELIFAGGETVRGYDPETGKELWVLSGPTQEVVPTIVVGDDLLYCASGRNGPTIALRPGGAGDVTETHLAWRAVRGGPHVPSPIYLNNRLYTVNDTGIATCFDGKSGELIWQDRIRDRFSASPIEAAGLLYFAAESGVTYVLRAADKFEIVSENDLGSPILASPAVFDDRMYVRTQGGLVCIGPDTAAAGS
jgi:hypothetical protein